MKHVFRDSNALEHCDYDEGAGHLIIKFHSGEKEHRWSCSKSVYDALKQAEDSGGSVGKHFHQHIRGKYPEV